MNPPVKRKRLPRLCLVIYLCTAASAFLYLIFTQSVAFADLWNGTVGAFLRRMLAWLSVWIPFSLAELMLILLPVLLVVVIMLGTKHYCDSARDMMIYVGMVSSAVCVVGILFVWSFAAGYFGTPLDEKLSLKREKSAAEQLYRTAELLSDELDALTEEIIFLEDGSSVMPYSYKEMNDKLIAAYDQVHARYDFIDSFDSCVKPVMLSKPMSYTHITGVYTFFTGEANINVNFPDYTIPFTAAHELAHQRGIAREDEANFVAFLVCSASDDPYIRYSGYLNLYEYVASALYSANRKLYTQSYTALPAEVRAERTAYIEFFKRYSENVAATVSESINNAYLQSQGAEAGTKSYGLVVDLAVAYYREK